MTTRELEIFSAVVECGSMSAAARKLRISQSSVSQVVVELERKYDVLLFERYAHTLHLTDVGSTLLEYARQTLNLARETETFLRGATQRPHLRVGASATVGSSVLCPLLDRLRGELPQIKLDVLVSNTQTIEDLLLRYQLDIGLVEGRITRQEMVQERVTGDSLALICGRGHPFYGRETVSLRELDGQTFLMREEGSGTRAQLEGELERCKVHYHVGWVANSPEALRQAVIHNFGLSALSPYTLRDSLRQGELWAFRAEGMDLSRQFTLVYHVDKYHAPAFARFRQICQALGDEAPV